MILMLIQVSPLSFTKFWILSVVTNPVRTTGVYLVSSPIIVNCTGKQVSNCSSLTTNVLCGKLGTRIQWPLSFPLA